MKDFWDKRYKEERYVYGESPNEFFKSQIDALSPGKILLPADGEGRNGVYAASKGWEVSAFDISRSGKEKAEHLAKRNKVMIDYQVGSLDTLSYPVKSFDAIALIFAHFSPELKSDYHEKFVQLLKPGGVMILEAFSKDHLRYSEANPKVGGPKNIDILYSLEEIKEYFAPLEEQMMTKTEVELSEGKYHQGTGSVVRYTGRKMLK